MGCPVLTDSAEPILDPLHLKAARTDHHRSGPGRQHGSLDQTVSVGKDHVVKDTAIAIIAEQSCQCIKIGGQVRTPDLDATWGGRGPGFEQQIRQPAVLIAILQAGRAGSGVCHDPEVAERPPPEEPSLGRGRFEQKLYSTFARFR